MKKLIIGISGASGVQMGVRLLQVLKKTPEVETHLVMSHGADEIFRCEMKMDVKEVKALADVVYDVDDLAAAISSGSFRTDGMVVIPCSMKSLSAIANAYDDNLLVRAADVCLKEGRKVVLVPREFPLNLIHCRNLLAAKEAGYVILPPMLTFYSEYSTLDEQVDHVIGKILMQFNLSYDKFRPWEGR